MLSGLTGKGPYPRVIFPDPHLSFGDRVPHCAQSSRTSPPPPPLHSSHLALQFHTYTSMPRLHVSAEDLNSGPHADTAHTNHGAIAPTSSIGFKHYYLLRPPPQFLWHQAIRSSVLLYPEVVRGLL